MIQKAEKKNRYRKPNYPEIIIAKTWTTLLQAYFLYNYEIRWVGKINRNKI